MSLDTYDSPYRYPRLEVSYVASKIAERPELLSAMLRGSLELSSMSCSLLYMLRIELSKSIDGRRNSCPARWLDFSVLV